jgi:hypothetical protein
MIPLGVAVVADYLRKSKWPAIIAIVAGSLFFSYCKGKTAGEEKEKASSLVAVNKLKAALVKAEDDYANELSLARSRLQASEANYREKEGKFNATISDLEKAYETAKNNIRLADRSVSNSLINGGARMRVQTSTTCLPVSQSSETNAAPSGANESNSGQLPGGIAQRLYDRAASADECARQITALQAWAMAALDLCNGKR